jgi:hypothetical protein
VPLALAGSARWLSGSGVALPLPAIAALMDALLRLQMALEGGPRSQAASASSPQPQPPDRSSAVPEGPAAASGGEALGRSLALPGPLWLAAFRASHRTMAQGQSTRQRMAAQATPQRRRRGARGGGAVPAHGLGQHSAGSRPRARWPLVSGGQLVALAYAFARHPPPQPPPDSWVRVLLQVGGTWETWAAGMAVCSWHSLSCLGRREKGGAAGRQATSGRGLLAEPACVAAAGHRGGPGPARRTGVRGAVRGAGAAGLRALRAMAAALHAAGERRRPGCPRARTPPARRTDLC